MLWIDCEKNTIFFLRMIGSNNRFNVCSATKYYNVVQIKDNIYEVDGKGTYFRLVSLKILHPNDIEFCSYDIAETLDKQYLLASYHSYVEFGQRIIVFEHHISLHNWIQQHPFVIKQKLNQVLISIL